MNFNERLGWLLLGCLIGFVFGYIVRSLREIKDDVTVIKEEVDEIDELVKEKRLQHRADDGGWVIPQIVKDVALLIVVLLTAFAAFASNSASNKSDSALDRVTNVSMCNQKILAQTIRALNIRTTSVQNRADANLELQKAQATFFTLLLHQPPFAEEKRREAADTYLKSLNNFVNVSNSSAQTTVVFPYPTNKQFTDCLVN